MVIIKVVLRMIFPWPTRVHYNNNGYLTEGTIFSKFVNVLKVHLWAFALAVMWCISTDGDRAFDHRRGYVVKDFSQALDAAQQWSRYPQEFKGGFTRLIQGCRHLNDTGAIESAGDLMNNAALAPGMIALIAIFLYIYSYAKEGIFIFGRKGKSSQRLALIGAWVLGYMWGFVLVFVAMPKRIFDLWASATGAIMSDLLQLIALNEATYDFWTKAFENPTLLLLTCFAGGAIWTLVGYIAIGIKGESRLGKFAGATAMIATVVVAAIMVSSK